MISLTTNKLNFVGDITLPMRERLNTFGVASVWGRVNLLSAQLIYFFSEINSSIWRLVLGGFDIGKEWKRVWMRKVLGTSRHPLKTLTSLQVFFCVCLEWMLVLIRHKCPNFPQVIYQEWYMQIDFIWFCLDSLFHSSYIFVFFKVSGKSMVECTWNPNVECRYK